MSSTDHRGIPPGNAAIIGAVSAALITACATVLAAWISVASGKVVITVGGTPSQQGNATEVLKISDLPQPTYTLLPTYTPYPTLKPNVTIITPKPLIVTATPSADQQDPPPGSTILAGQSFSRNGVQVTMYKTLDLHGSAFAPRFTIENHSGQQLIVLWKESFIHARDDKGKVYHQGGEDSPNFNSTKQFSISDGDSTDIVDTVNSDMDATVFYPFKGSIDTSTKYLVFTIDQMAGVTNMNWRYDLQ